jgi:hypothetical protein
MWARAALRGAVAGLAGVAVMTAGEKLEQRVTGRPDSYLKDPVPLTPRTLGPSLWTGPKISD